VSFPSHGPTHGTFPDSRRFFPKRHARQQVETVFSNLETGIGHEPLWPLKTVTEPLTPQRLRWRRELTCSLEIAVMGGVCATGSVPIHRRAVSPSTGGTDARQFLGGKKEVDDEYELGWQPVMATSLLMWSVTARRLVLRPEPWSQRHQ
jgi:hypothetical protein